MRQKAEILEVNGETAKIKVLRSSMCEGCEKRGNGTSCACGALAGANRVIIAEASNEIGASAGDFVEIETDSSAVLSAAALVFLLPIAAFFLGYAAAERIFASETLPWAIGAGAFVLSFIPSLAAEHRMRRKKCGIRITAVLNQFYESRQED